MTETQPTRRSRTDSFKEFFRKFKLNGRRTSEGGRKRTFSISKPNPVNTQPIREAGDGVSFDEVLEGPLQGEIKRLPGHPRDTNDPDYWGPTNKIPESDLKKLLRRHLHDEWNGQVSESDYQLKQTIRGGFNVAYILQSAIAGAICIRVPACGWTLRWNHTDAELVRASALGMKYIADKSNLPVPELLAFDISLDNEIRAPYVIMTFIEGGDGEELWDARTVHTSAVERKRQAILRNLAMLMPRLQATQFNQGGPLYFDRVDQTEPVVGSTWHLNSTDIFTIRREFSEEPRQESVRQMLLSGKQKRFQDIARGSEDSIPFRTGVFMLWSLMIEAFLQVASLEPGEPEFVLMQSDFNPPNIMTREDGEIVGFLDWDCLKAVPRQIGWCSIPHWLQHDWHDDWEWPMVDAEKPNLQPSEYDRYRRDYVRYMQEACEGKGDCRFTSKSHIYQALFDSLEVWKKVQYFVINVLMDILPRHSRILKQHLEIIGSNGWRSDEGEMEWFQAQFREYFRPDMLA